jgi:hypothetical protein
LTDEAGPWDSRLLGDDDGEYFCRVLLNSKGVRFVPGSIVYYRTVDNSLSYIGQSSRKMHAHWLSMQLHIRYLRQLDDSPAGRAACIAYLQNWLFQFHPERSDIVEEARSLAEELGGKLSVQELSWKYRWADAAFGRTAAKRIMFSSQRLKWSFRQLCDKLMSLGCRRLDPVHRVDVSGVRTLAGGAR